MLRTRLANPSVPLRPYVWCYGQTDGHVEGGPLVVPLPARPKQVLTFFFGDPYCVRLRRSGLYERSPQTLVVGPQSYHRLDVLVSGQIDTFTIHFQPAGFHHLFGVPMTELRDASYDAKALIGNTFRVVEHQLADDCRFAERIQLIESVLIDRLRNARTLDLVGVTANRLFAINGLMSVSEMAASACLAPRQYERRFLQQVGISPKLYARIVRFNAALARKLAARHRTWTEIAHELGYHDHMHMVHDFQGLAGDSPSRFAGRLDLVPEFHTMFATSTRAYVRR